MNVCARDDAALGRRLNPIKGQMSEGFMAVVVVVYT
jgi:hypothetical protein